MGQISEKIMWDAVVHCNEDYDGIFYYAVRSTGIVCKPSCKSKTPLKENVVYFSSVSLAVQEGYRPCKRCRPDLLLSNEEEMIFSAKQMIEHEYCHALTLERLAKMIGVSKFHLQRLFTKNIGMSPQGYLTKLRINEAKKQLKTTNATVTEIAHKLGYKSSAHFSSVFHRQLGITPSEYKMTQPIEEGK